MNRNLNGVALTRDDLANIAVGAGLLDADSLSNLIAAVHNDNLVVSRLKEITCNVRFSMWSDGLLLLDTRTPANSPAPS